MKRAFPLHSLIVVATLMGGAAWLLACTASSGVDETTSTPGAAGPQAGNGDAVGATQGGSKCEELGALSATALSGKLDTSQAVDSQTTSFTLPNRPTATKVKVVGVGAASDLIGRASVLGANVNASYRTCTHCLVVAIGCTASSCAGAALFFPRTGTGTFTALAAKNGQPFAGTFADVELEQVTINPETFASTPLVNGACMHVSTLTFGSTLSSEDDDAGGTSSGSGRDSGLEGGDDGGSSGTSGQSSTSSGGEANVTKTL